MSVKYKFKIVGAFSFVGKSEWLYSSIEPDSDDYNDADDCDGSGIVDDNQILCRIFFFSTKATTIIQKSYA